MIIKKIKTKPLLVTNKKPYFWSAGITLGAEGILVELQTSDGIIGYGESISTPDSYAIKALIDKASESGGDYSRINGIDFNVDDPSMMMQGLRRQAVEDAVEKAKDMAEAA